MARPSTPSIAAGIALTVTTAAAYRRAIRPRLLRWGATDEEATKSLPGDEIIPDPGIVTTHAVTIGAPPVAVWPWLIQMGPGRAGAYTFDWVENLCGLDMHSADRIVPEWQQMAVGDAFQLSRNGPPLRIAILEPERAMVAAMPDGSWSWAFVLEPLPGSRTRLVTRNRIPTRRLRDRVGLELMLPGAFLMEQQMLRGIKQRAEMLAVQRDEKPRTTEREAAAPVAA